MEGRRGSMMQRTFCIRLQEVQSASHVMNRELDAVFCNHVEIIGFYQLG